MSPQRVNRIQTHSYEDMISKLKNRKNTVNEMKRQTINEMSKLKNKEGVSEDSFGDD